METRDGSLWGGRAFLTVLCCFSLAVIYFSTQIYAFGQPSSPATIPFACGLAMFASSVFLMLRSADSPKSGSVRPLSARGAFFAALSMIYVGVLDTIGFVIATSVFLFASFIALGRRRTTGAAAYALLSVAVIYLLFRIFFLVLLPEGVLPERRLIASLQRLFSW